MEKAFDVYIPNLELALATMEYGDLNEFVNPAMQMQGYNVVAQQNAYKHIAKCNMHNERRSKPRGSNQ